MRQDDSRRRAGLVLERLGEVSGALAQVEIIRDAIRAAYRDGYTDASRTKRGVSDFAEAFRRAGGSVKGLTTAQIGEICKFTPEQIAAAKERWLRDYPELAAWFEAQTKPADS